MNLTWQICSLAHIPRSHSARTITQTSKRRMARPKTCKDSIPAVRFMMEVSLGDRISSTMRTNHNQHTAVNHHPSYMHSHTLPVVSGLYAGALRDTDYCHGIRCVRVGVNVLVRRTTCAILTAELGARGGTAFRKEGSIGTRFD